MRISHAIRTLITSDFLFNSGFSLFGPIFAVFVMGQVGGGSVQVVGFAAAITQIIKAVLQIPVARYLDKNHGEYDDFYSLVSGSVIVASTPFLYFFASSATHIYIIQAWYGIGLALAVPPWYAIFTRHIDRMRENLEWSLESIAIGISGAGAAAVGGILAEVVGFRGVFLIAGCFAVLGVVFQIRIYRDLRAFVGRHQVRPTPDKAG
ncbi:MAG: MFS transporter [Candidatus Yanofskybacteria bacterium]|nr:MFS transporter [Candidatus Yanofskybacteria bacterium]